MIKDLECKPPSFPEFSQKIQQAIDEFKAVFIKSNWSTPSVRICLLILCFYNISFLRTNNYMFKIVYKDATWVTPTKSLKCTSLEDVYLLLKSSDRISNDLNKVENLSDNKNPFNFYLVIKRWKEINPCTEFRCFVIKNELMGNQVFTLTT